MSKNKQIQTGNKHNQPMYKPNQANLVFPKFLYLRHDYR